MRLFNWGIIALICLPLSLGSVAVFGQDSLMITISNDTSDNLLVTVYDSGTSPPQQILAGRPIYGNASIVVSISQDSSGKGHLYWSATNIDRDMRMCGHDDRPNLNDGDTVRVYADSDCAG